MTIPEIRITFGELAYDNETKVLAETFNLDLKSKEYYFQKTYDYWKEWRKHESKILAAMQKILGVNFYLKTIDVSCIPFFIPKSAPMIMNFKETPERFVDVLTHELAHILLTDNDKYQTYNEAPKHVISDEWAKMFGSNHSSTTLVHIPVHALCRYIWIDVFNDPAKMDKDIEDCKTWEGGEHYLKSWEYVNGHDYHEIITKVKEVYV